MDDSDNEALAVLGAGLRIRMDLTRIRLRRKDRIRIWPKKNQLRPSRKSPDPDLTLEKTETETERHKSTSQWRIRDEFSRVRLRPFRHQEKNRTDRQEKPDPGPILEKHTDPNRQPWLDVSICLYLSWFHYNCFSYFDRDGPDTRYPSGRILYLVSCRIPDIHQIQKRLDIPSIHNNWYISSDL